MSCYELQMTIIAAKFQNLMLFILPILEWINSPTLYTGGVQFQF